MDTAALLGCSRCPRLCVSRSRVVPSKGPTKARILIVAQAPGRQEDAAGVPLVGRSGQQLDRLLKLHAGVDAATVRMTNVVKCYPERDRKPTTREIRECREWLINEIIETDAEIVVTLGDVALQALVPGEHLSQVHGQVIASMLSELPRQVVVFPTYHPSATNYNANLKPILIEDFKRLGAHLSGKPARVGRDGWRFGTLREIMQEGHGAYAIDYETTQPLVDGHFAPSLAEPIGIAVARRVGRAVVATYEPPRVIADFKPILEAEGVERVAHNTKFERMVSLRAGVDLGLTHDTKIMAHLLGLPSSRLKDLSGTLLDVRQTRFEEWDGVDPTYPCQDAAYTLMLYELLSARLRDEGLWNVYYTVELPLVPVLADIERRGIAVDNTALAALGVEVAARLAAIEADFAGVNLNSPQQIAHLLYDTLGVPPPTRFDARRRLWVPKLTKGGATPTGKEILEEIDHSAARALVEHRELSKLRGAYIEKLPRLIQADGRVHGQFHQAGGHDDDSKSKESPATYRLSSSNPNLQNIPYRTLLGKRVYTCFVPAEGYVFVKADAGQEEPRIAAVITGDRVLTERLTNGVDIYLPLAQHAYNLMQQKYASEPAAMLLGGVDVRAPLVLTKKQHEWRQVGKKFFLATLYGARATKLQEIALKDLGLMLTGGEADVLSKKLRGEYPGIAALASLARIEAERDGYVTTIMGHRRLLYGALSRRLTDKEAAIREGANMKVQGVAAAMLKVALRRVWAALRGHDAHIVLTVHDSVVVESVPTEVDYVKSVLSHAFDDLIAIPVPVDLEVSTHG